jgi:hypothetical protein
MSGRIGGLVGRNPTSQSRRRGQLYGLPQREARRDLSLGCQTQEPVPRSPAL